MSEDPRAKPATALPPLREVIAAHGLSALKGLGQHFLLDLNLTRKIVKAADLPPGATVLEVGPGPGGLSRALLERDDVRLTMIEKDRRFLDALQPLQDLYGDRVRLLHEDALKVDETTLFAPGEAVHVVSNLPYNVGTPLLVKWLTAEPWPPWYKSLTLMLQKEVAERITAPPGGKTYGRLSVLCQWRADVRRPFDVPAAAFVPPPKVTSAIVRIVPHAVSCEPGLATSLEAVTRAAFSQRRKMVKSTLKPMFADVAAVLAKLSIDPAARAETLSVEAYVCLARARLAEPRER